jgi:hypothetical protein
VTLWRILVTCEVVAAALIVWCWIRWLRSTPSTNPPLFRKVMTAASLIALSTSCIVLAVVFLATERFVGLHGHEAPFDLFMSGLGAALLGGLVAASAVDAVRDILSLSAAILLIQWFIFGAHLEPGAW